ncbi:hypothetical protein AVEN_11354-1 [Araneus ventricosus]|uniref:Uncharacterized protein n=1 Tax=Araneus ventricosus TaxID=182803 RepID=A0A4Y2HC69_ARAVE|nr:hypothetical protein AVEN_11354-1 [Araneus ventricosus]
MNVKVTSAWERTHPVLNQSQLSEEGIRHKSLRYVQLSDFCKPNELIERNSAQIVGCLWAERLKPKRSQLLVLKIQKWTSGYERLSREENKGEKDFTNG